MMKFRVLRGSHRIGAERDKNGNVVVPGKNVKRGGIVESEVDLCKKFPSFPPKFERIDVVVEQEEDIEQALRKMTKQQLIAKAEAEELDIEGCNTKDEIIASILMQTEE